MPVGFKMHLHPLAIRAKIAKLEILLHLIDHAQELNRMIEGLQFNFS